jgi:serine/threonine protein kinase
MTEEPDVKLQKKIVDDYYEGTILGKGGFGSAILCNKMSENNAKYVIKQIDFMGLDKRKKSKRFDTIANEIFILDILRSHCGEYIMCYIKTLIEGPSVYIVCEYLENFKCLDKIYTENYSVEVIAKLCNNLLLGLEKIHSLNVCHRDIKPANIMYNVQTYEIKYIDFGLSLLLIDGNVTSSNAKISVGTPNYLYPPFYPDADQIPTFTFETIKQSDRFSLGMAFFVLLSKGKTIVYYVQPDRRLITEDIYNFNERLEKKLVIFFQKLEPIYLLENQVSEYAAEHGLKYTYFTTLMGVNRPAITEDEKKLPVVPPSLVPSSLGETAVPSSLYPIPEETNKEINGGRRRFTKKMRNRLKKKRRNSRHRK